MHLEEDDRGQLPQRKRAPLLRPPKPGTWSLWHGPQAQTVVDLARETGQPADTGPQLGNLPAMPADFPKPSPQSPGAWELSLADRRYYVRIETHDQYVSCYIFAFPLDQAPIEASAE